jgi:hypothetical protein
MNKNPNNEEDEITDADYEVKDYVEKMEGYREYIEEIRGDQLTSDAY